MAKLTYKEQLLHPNWQRKRLQVLESAGFCCEICGDSDSTLHVHHRRYVKGREVWEYERDELLALCATCHAEQHEIHKLLEEVLAKVDILGDPYKRALALIAGYLTAAYELDEDLVKRSRAAVGWAAFDVGVAAYAIATSNRQEAASALSNLSRNEVNGPVLDDVLSRWSEPPRAEPASPFDEIDGK